MRDAFLSFAKDQRGVTAIEYALIAGIISLVIVVSARVMGMRVAGWANDVAANLAS